MKCVVCGATVTGELCPECEFPVIHFPGDPEEGLRRLQPQIDAFRDAFLDKISVGVIAYRWQDKNGKLEKASEEIRTIGNGKELWNGTVWLSELFARLPDEEEIHVNLSVCVKGGENRRTIRLPNLLQPQLQELGASLDHDMRLRLFLRNGSGCTESEPEPLFS